MSSKNVSHIFEILFQSGDIDIFVPHGVLSGRYVQLKSSFSAKKIPSVMEFETHFGRETIKV